MMAVDSFAKINLGLDVVGKRSDGYHEVATVYQAVGLKDTIRVLLLEESVIKIVCTNPLVPVDEKNLAFKAAKILFEHKGMPGQGVEIQIEKTIPVASGLAGGSSNAAAVLNALNHLLKLGCTKQELMGYAAEIGADVPFFFLANTALGKGIGETLTPLKSFSEIPIVIVNPKIKYFNGRKKTSYVYALFDLESERGLVKPEQHPDINAVVEAIEKKDLKKLGESAKNVFEPVVFKQYPTIRKLKEQLLEEGAACALMSGAGPSVFGLFDSEKNAAEAAAKFKSAGTAFVTKTI
jgi:4-diphosphocytidyl-2-C-methyl-D-erythritol kinase